MQQRQRPQHVIIFLLDADRCVPSLFQEPGEQHWLMTCLLCDTPSVIEVIPVWHVYVCVAATYFKLQEDSIYLPNLPFAE